jgi:hypothetical protein
MGRFQDLIKKKSNFVEPLVPIIFLEPLVAMDFTIDIN